MARILVIDDEESVRTLLRMVLEQVGHTVIEARGGTEGLALFSQARVDLVITDLVMPDTDGLEVLRELGRMDPSLKILAISGGDVDRGAVYLNTARLMGAATVLAKPFGAAQLRAAVNELLPGDGT
jgi:DNA-binding response OmpR family regulator